MAISSMAANDDAKEKDSPLHVRLAKALPHGFVCNYRYIRTPAKLCDPLFSALPGSRPERTRLSSHFLTICVDPSMTPAGQASSLTSGELDVISFAIEVLIYTTKSLTTIFVSKIDSTSYIPRQRPSPVKLTATTFLKYLADDQMRRDPHRKVVISLFARAQAQYLFPGSSDDRGPGLSKHVLDDRQLIKWWAQVLDPILPDDGASGSGTRYQAYMTVPGYEGNELRRAFMPAVRGGSSTYAGWVPGNPLLELAQARGVPEHAPPRCLLPRFPDDPKSRFIEELDDEAGITDDAAFNVSPSKRKAGRWNSIRDLRSFWETMEFRQECSSGRVVGFLWLVISPTSGADPVVDFEVNAPKAEGPSANSSETRKSRSKLRSRPKRSDKKQGKASDRKPLAGLIIPRVPRIKGGSSRASLSGTSLSRQAQQTETGVMVSKEGYDKAMQKLLKLDFGNIRIAIQSTRNWISDVQSIRGSSDDFAVAISGIATTTAAAAASSTSSAPTVNDLGGMIRKKRKAPDETSDIASGVPASDTISTPNGASSVDVLGASTIRKKPKQVTA